MRPEPTTLRTKVGALLSQPGAPLQVCFKARKMMGMDICSQRKGRWIAKD